MKPLMSVQGLTRRFGGLAALEDVTLEVPDGGVHAIIGPNGAGKTTMLNVLTGVYAPSEGKISFGATDLTGQPSHMFARHGIGRTFQTPQIFFNMSALENVMVGLHRHESHALLPAMLRLPRMAVSERNSLDSAVGHMRAVGLGAYLGADSSTLPYGALKRLEVARALASRPRLLLLDEPAAGLNPSEAVELAELIRDIAAGGITVVLVEHNMRLVMSISETIFVLDQGRRLASGTPAQVRDDPLVIKAYLGAQDDEDA